ncbi:MAG TPA: serine O-acetyltransferase [Rhodopseudomonas sp.]|uniref:serine O-acetyltransferase n=1 Tax=Rhodopseudomonas sp. TaxID=1078 RepID=UPI002ED89EBA
MTPDGRLNLDIHASIREHLAVSLSSRELGALLPFLADILIKDGALLQGDLLAFAHRDPASNGNTRLILESYVSFEAVLYFRVASRLWRMDGLDRSLREVMAHKLTGAGKAASGADIHPAAQIGECFVLDHGYGTVIGETCIIGSGCYILNGVVLGSSGIADNPAGLRRHPRIGNNVQIGANVRVFGAVEIGDNVFLSPCCVVTRNIPSNSRVTIVNQLQVARPSGVRRDNCVSAYAQDDRLHLVGTNAMEFSVSIVDSDFMPADWLSLQKLQASRDHVQYPVSGRSMVPLGVRRPLNLELSSPKETSFLIEPPGLAALAENASLASQQVSLVS